MSSQHPRPPRSRRRIAGERRPLPPEEEVGTAPPPPEPVPQPVSEPVPEPVSEPVPEPVPEPDPEPAPADASRGDDERAGSAGPSWLLVGAVGALAAVLLVTASVLGLAVWRIGDVREADRVDDAARTAPAAAERASVALLSYDYRRLDADQQAAERYLTPAYRTEYADTFAQVKEQAPALKAKVQAEVKASGVTHADPDRVAVLLYVNQTTTSTAAGGRPQVALNRVQLSMVRRDGRWLVEDITSY
jgi:Mce-associated membrane protein